MRPRNQLPEHCTHRYYRSDLQVQHGLHPRAHLPERGADLTTDRICHYDTNCTLGSTFQSAAPTLTTGRVCHYDINCTLGVTFQSVAPTLTTDRVCGNNVSLACAKLNSTFQSAAPTLTTDRVCHYVTNCTLNSTFQNAVPTLTTDQICKNVSPLCQSGINYAVTRPTLTSDRGNCTACTPDCPAGTTTSAPCTPYEDLECTRVPGTTDKSKKLTSAQIEGIAAGAVAAAALLTAIALAISRRTGYLKRQIEDQRVLLSDADQNAIEMTEQLEIRSKVWQIPEAHITFESLLASGSFGEVWRGAYGGQTVAIKQLKRPLDDQLDPAAAKDYQRENEVLQRIRHPHLLVFFGAGVTTAGRKPFLVTEFMELGSLRGVLADAGRELEWAVRHRMASEIAAGMAHLHSLNIVHRDLKSDNCLCDGRLNTKVADFGASKLMRTAALGGGMQRSVYEDSLDGAVELGGMATQTMTKGTGTPLWMAPEVFAGYNRYGPEVDVYSFGIIMWELLTRREPWDEIEAESNLEFSRQLAQALTSGRRPALAAEIEQCFPEFAVLMRKCWAAKPRARPGFTEVAKSLWHD